jgi:predicted transposase/invertase (TIGR01784 family)
VTIHFLNAVLDPEDPITAVEILNPIQGKDRSEDKLVVLDVLAEDSVGRTFNIEMQTTIPLDLPQRLTYYGCLNLVRQIGEGDAYMRLRPSISICVLAKNLFPQIDGYHLSFRLRCDQTSDVFTDALEFHTLELPKFEVVSDNGSIKHRSAVEKWLYFLRHAEHLDAEELRDQLMDPAFEQAVGVLEMIARTPEEHQFYEARLKFLRDEEAKVMAARLEGREEGREEGRRMATISIVHMLEELLGDSPTDRESLSGQSFANLEERVEELRKRLSARDA